MSCVIDRSICAINRLHCASDRSLDRATASLSHQRRYSTSIVICLWAFSSRIFASVSFGFRCCLFVCGVGGFHGHENSKFHEAEVSLDREPPGNLRIIPFHAKRQLSCDFSPFFRHEGKIDGPHRQNGSLAFLSDEKFIEELKLWTNNYIILLEKISRWWLSQCVVNMSVMRSIVMRSINCRVIDRLSRNRSIVARSRNRSIGQRDRSMAQIDWSRTT